MYGRKMVRAVSIILIMALLFTLMPMLMTGEVKAAEAPPIEVNGPTLLEAENLDYVPAVFTNRNKNSGNLALGKELYASTNGSEPIWRDADGNLTANPGLEFIFKAVEEGTYNIWLLVNSSTPNKNIWVSNFAVTDGTLVTFGGVGGQWQWKSVRSYSNLAAGTEVRVRMKPNLSGFSIDKICIAKSGFTPSGDPLQPIDITVEGAASVALGNTLQLTAMSPSVGAAYQSVTWSVYQGSGAAIDQTGLLTGTAKGTVIVRAAANDASGIFGEKLITITDPNRVPVSGITVSGQNDAARMDAGGTLQMTAAVMPAEATYKAVTWSLQSSIKPGSSINAETGVITAGAKADRLLIRATAKDDSGVYGETTITVFDTSVVFEPPPYNTVDGHPRLLFRAEDIPAIKANMQKVQNKNALDAHLKNLLTATSGILPKTAATTENFNEKILTQIESYAFDYAINGNEASGRTAINAMRNYVNTVIFDYSQTGSVYNKTGVTIYTISAVYDWCFPLLTEDDRNLFAQKICEFTEFKTGYPPTMLGNINGHGAEGPILRDLMSAAVAMADEFPFIYQNVAGRYFNRMVAPRSYLYQTHSNLNGMWYTHYRSPWEILSTIIVDKGFNIPKVYGLDQQYLLYWSIYSQRPDGGQLKDGDGSGFNKNFNRSATLFGGYYKDPFLKYLQIRSNLNFTLESPYQNITMNPVEFLLFNDPDLTPKAFNQLPLTKYFASPRGSFIARTGWEEGVEAPTVVAEMKVNEVFIGSHQHLDAGSFQIYYKGALATDDGVYKGAKSGVQQDSSDYGSDHWKNYALRTVAHNAVTVLDPDEVFKTGVTGYVNDGGQRYPNNGTEPGNREQLENPNSEYRTGKVLGQEYGLDPIAPNYTYLKGDLTGAYSSKISDYERSFMFLNLKDKDHPAAMIVFDRVISSNESFKKAWLLHGLEQPEVSGNRTIFRNTRLDSNFQYNGKLTVDTLLPKADNTEISIIGGPGQEHWSGGSNHYGQPSGATEGVGYRIEVSPKAAAQTDYFLNVLQMTDANPDVAALPVTMIETEKRVGVVVSDRVAVFGRAKERTQEPVEFSFTNAGEFEITVADLKEGTWSIAKDGNVYGTAVATLDGGVGVFKGGPGAYRLVYAGTQGERPPVLPEPIKEPAIGVMANGLPVYSEVSPLMQGNSLLLPVGILKNFHAEVAEADGAATITLLDTEVKLTAESGIAYVNQSPVTMAVPAVLKEGRLLVPVDFISQALNLETVYHENVQILAINEKESTAGTPEEGYITIKDSSTSEVTAGSEPKKSYDQSNSTYWAAHGYSGQWVQYDMGKIVDITSALIMWHNKKTRQAVFNIEVSDDGAVWRKLFENNITGSLSDNFTFEEYVFPTGTKARYVKITPFGTTKDDKNTINEIKFRAGDSTKPVVETTPPTDGGYGGNQTRPEEYNAIIQTNGSKEMTLPVAVDEKANSASINLNEFIKTFQENEVPVISIPAIPGVNAYTLEIPVPSLSAPQNKELLVLATAAGSITIPGNMVKGMAHAQGGVAGITIGLGDKAPLPAEIRAAIGDRPMARLALTIDGKQVQWENPNAPTRVRLPYTPTEGELKDPEYIVIWAVDGSGKIAAVPSGRYDAATGTVAFTATHFNNYAVAYVHKSFQDLAGVEWAKKSIEVMASKGIIDGTSANAYAPSLNITRADYLHLLVKTLGLTAEAEGNFGDVSPGDYYYQALGIAKKLGIAAGTGNNRFDPKSSITRQDMLTLTARALEVFKGLKMEEGAAALEQFYDRGDISPYAMKSLNALVKEGLVAGMGDGRLSPGGLATRAEAAVFLYRIYTGN